MAHILSIGNKLINLDRVNVILPWNIIDKDSAEITFTIAASMADKFEVLKKFSSQTERDAELKTIHNKFQ